MDSSLHMHVASLKIQDEIRRASTARLAKQAKQASQPVAMVAGAPRARWVTLRRVLPQSSRRAY
jgi:sugar/nucleoside kinase (ribokinase family)